MNWRVPLSDLVLSKEDKNAVMEVLNSGWLSMGDATQHFEEAFAEMVGVKHAIAVSNATVGLHLAALALQIGPGDEVILPSLSFVATANAVVYTGASPVFADVMHELDLGVSLESIERQISEKTKAITVMHYGGNLCAMPEIIELAGDKGLNVIEDAAHAPGAKLDGRNAGAWGDIACFSFFSNKNLATGEGGMVVTDRDDLADKVRLQRSHGMTTLTLDRHKGHAFSYDVVDLGFNYRIDEMRSALGLVQLQKLEANNLRRREISDSYRSDLGDMSMLSIPYMDHPGISAEHIFPVLLGDGVDRQAFMEVLKTEGIQTSIHYPPIHQFSYYRGRFGENHLPVTEAIGRREVTLPLFPSMTDEQVEIVVEGVKTGLEQAGVGGSGIKSKGAGEQGGLGVKQHGSKGGRELGSWGVRAKNIKKKMKKRMNWVADKVLKYEWAMLVLIAYPMLFPKPAWTPVMLVIPLLWFFHWKRGNGIVPSTPLNFPILLLMIMLAVSLWATFSIKFSLPKISGLVFALGVFFATVRYSVRDIRRALLFFFACGLALGAVGLLATNWSAKLPILDRIMSQLPQVITSLPAAEQGIHPNELGGLLILFVPAAVYLGWKAFAVRPRNDRILLILAISSAVGLGILTILTQSRSALIGLIAAVGVLLISCGKLGRILFGVGFLITVTLIFWKGPDIILGGGDPLQSNSIVFGELSFASRQEIWSRAIYALNDFSVTGMGVGTFRQIAPILYPFFMISPSFDIGHAHNFLLQTGLDFGILGLIGMLGIWIVGLLILFLAIKSKKQQSMLDGISLGDLATGLMASLIAHFIYGLTDAVALGARPGLILWMALGLAAGIYILSMEHGRNAEGIACEIGRTPISISS